MRALHRTVRVPAAAVVTSALIACGLPPSGPHVTQVVSSRPVSARPAARPALALHRLTAAQRAAFRRWIRAVVLARWLDALRIAHENRYDWECISIAETGGDWTAHGPSYSSALGVMNQAVRENSPPDVAARILAGTASRAEQITMASRIADRFGIDAWAASTVARCT